MRIEFRENGSIGIETGGRVVLRIGDQEQIIERPRISLCRCGHSNNKPLCDGSHRAAGFTAPAAVIELGLAKES
ncbi:CDGSH iron-sulfur domain-containing protein [Meiothermus sp. QL-1]|uniref:CDGSH iron-sulfur domain-containing protein n=1 Tax=Meiothermus sp. QL-1 TaxID=2058095 RepID=UPI000E0A607A|nr:CDGSH iron-sulfur domain-containing protein [Meiothermus sp. QL-1]RDI95098.1 CDGSH iron-sulfur domain-containing protein [Meiothermus sp. QL-1]